MKNSKKGILIASIVILLLTCIGGLLTITIFRKPILEYLNIFNESTEEVEETMVQDRDNIDLNLNEENYPKIDGSSSTRPLAKHIACYLLEVECHWQDQRFDNRRYYVPQKEYTDQLSNNESIIYNISHSGTHGSYETLINKQSDLIIVARKPSPDEISLANQKDVELEITPVALDGFIFIVNAENPVSDLTTEEIQDIYTGKITNWKEVSGSDTEISAYQRNENSGSQELMETLVMKDLEFQNNLGEMILYGMMGPINMISEDQQGLGYSVFYYKEFIAPNDKLKSIAVDGVKPTSDTISDQSYPYTTKVYAVIRKDLEVESSAYKMRNWLLTDEGQDVVEESGYVAVE